MSGLLSVCCCRELMRADLLCLQLERLAQRTPVCLVSAAHVSHVQSLCLIAGRTASCASATSPPTSSRTRSPTSSRFALLICFTHFPPTKPHAHALGDVLCVLLLAAQAPLKHHDKQRTQVFCYSNVQRYTLE